MILSDILFIIYCLFTVGYVAATYMPQFDKKRFEMFKRMNGVSV